MNFVRFFVEFAFDSVVLKSDLMFQVLRMLNSFVKEKKWPIFSASRKKFFSLEQLLAFSIAIYQIVAFSFGFPTMKGQCCEVYSN